MTEIISEDHGTGDRSLLDGFSNEQHCHSSDLIAEWRSSEQVEGGIPSTSPSFWDIDDDDGEPKPSQLYGRFTWKIERFLTINKELKSDIFEIGGSKWYILIYPQGCGICNHISLFLCVANHNKFLPGWGHFAQFTIAVVNKDPKKSKYSDTLHRFSKKEHDWGWKKFMEISKVNDGFIIADALVIKAQVQVIREKALRLFRCLDCQYRRELLKVYLSNVEQICRRCIEEWMDKFKQLVDDKMGWPSFCSFWLEMDASDKSSKCREKTDAILKIVVKHFFMEKEVTSTLVMDSLYGGLKAIECCSKNKEEIAELIGLEDLPDPMICVDNDMFVLADDLLLLLQRAASELLPHQILPSKDDKSSQNRMEEGSSGEEYSKDSLERDERRLMELGLKTLEFFVLGYIFSKIEVSYHEDVAWKRQEELIREEAASLAENEQKAKRSTTEKEKRAKKKQVKQKHINRKAKVRDEKRVAASDKHQPENPSDNTIIDDLCSAQVSVAVLGKASEDSRNQNVFEVLQPYLEDTEASLLNWEADASEICASAEAGGDKVNNQNEIRSQSPMDGSSSTCSTDSAPSVVINVPLKRNALQNNRSQPPTNRVLKQQSKLTKDRSVHNPNSQLDVVHNGRSSDVTKSKTNQSKSEAAELNSKIEIERPQKHLVKKNEEVASLQKKLSSKGHAVTEKPFKTKSRQTSSASPGEKPPYYVFQQPKKSAGTTSLAVSKTRSRAQVASSKEMSSSTAPQADKSVNLSLKPTPVFITSRPYAGKQINQAKTTKRTNSQQVTLISRPSHALPTPGPRPSAPTVSKVQTVPVLSHSVSVAGRVGSDPFRHAHGYTPQSYRNVALGKTTVADAASGLTHQAASPGQVLSHSQSPSIQISTASLLATQSSTRTDQMLGRPDFMFGSVKPEAVQNQLSHMGNINQEVANSNWSYFSDISCETERLDNQGGVHLQTNSPEHASVLPQRQARGLVTDDFPHLDIINYLLDDEHGIRRPSEGYLRNFSGQYSLPLQASRMDVGSASRLRQFDQSEHYHDGGFQNAYDGANMKTGHLPQALANQWPYCQTNQPVHNLGVEDASRYSYQFPGHSSLTNQAYKYFDHPAEEL